LASSSAQQKADGNAQAIARNLDQPSPEHATEQENEGKKTKAIRAEEYEF